MNAQEFSEKVEETQIIQKNKVISLIDEKLQSHNGLTNTEGFYLITLPLIIGTDVKKLTMDIMVGRGFEDVEILCHGLFGYTVKFKLPQQRE